jgi:hypothetical protein
MHTIIIKLTPGRLTNPDLDIRYVPQDLIVEKSGGRIKNDGYDYDFESGADEMLIYLLAEDPEEAVALITSITEGVPVLGNDLRGATEVRVDD